MPGITDIFGSGPYLNFGNFIDDPYYNFNVATVAFGLSGTIVAIDFKEDYLLLRPGDILRLNLAIGIDARARITYDRYTQV